MLGRASGIQCTERGLRVKVVQVPSTDLTHAKSSDDKFDFWLRGFENVLQLTLSFGTFLTRKVED